MSNFHGDRLVDLIEHNVEDAEAEDRHRDAVVQGHARDGVLIGFAFVVVCTQETAYSASVLDALARALQLDDVERTHLFRPRPRGQRPPRAIRTRPDGARTAEHPADPRHTRLPGLRPDRRGDVVAVNTLCTALYGDILNPDALPLNIARSVLLDPRAPDFFLDWESVADDTAAALRIEAGRTPTDRRLSDLVGELATRSDAFAQRWGKHHVRLHRTATKRLRNAVVGDLELTGDALHVPGEDLTLIVYTAPLGSPDQEKLDFLTRWADQPHPARTAELTTPHASETRARSCRSRPPPTGRPIRCAAPGQRRSQHNHPDQQGPPFAPGSQGATAMAGGGGASVGGGRGGQLAVRKVEADEVRTPSAEATMTAVTCQPTGSPKPAAGAPRPAPATAPREKPAWNRGMIGRPGSAVSAVR